MLKPAALVLLAVAAIQVELRPSSTVTDGEVDLSACPVVFYGREYTRIQMSHSKLAFYSPGADPDYLQLGNSQGDQMSVDIRQEPTNVGSETHDLFPLIQSNSSCWVEVDLQDETNTTYLLLSFYNFGTEGGLIVKATSVFNQGHVSLMFQLSQNQNQKLSVRRSEAQSGSPHDLSACRRSGDLMFRGEAVYDAETCTNTTCSSVAVLTRDSTCEATERCDGGSRCVPRTLVCSVTGSTVVDFLGRTHSVTNRCAYTLTKPQGSSAYNILAGFRERRRQDVMFLDHLILWLEEANVTMYMEQGGRVHVDGQTLELNATAQLVHDVELSKDQAGVTARIPAFNVTVYFDGKTAHVADFVVTLVQLTGLPTAVEGLCGDPGDSQQTTTLTAEKSTSYSISGCETEHTDAPDETVNCSVATERCNLLLQAPFTACHDYSDPGAYITACTNTLCSYPAVDGLDCQFLEAYAESCRLQTVPLEEWRQAVGCPADPPSSCLDRYCSDHEFCADQNGEALCLCRAVFASKYNDANALGDPTVCTNNSASVSLAGCLLQDKGIDYTMLHLKDENCKGHMDNETHMVTFGFDLDNACGAEIVTNGSQVLYKNTIMTSDNSSSSDVIHHNETAVTFSCYYEDSGSKTMGFRIRESSVMQTMASGIWNYTLIMNAYMDADLTQLVKPTSEIRLNQRVWVEMKTMGLDDETVAIVIDSCWATDEMATNGSLSSNLISNGCPNSMDNTVELVHNGVGTSNYFSFNMFEFSENKDNVYLHCEVKLCIKQEGSCVKTCVQGRRRRSARRRYAETNPALITMIWVK